MWFEHIPAAITVCDNKGVIVFMNDKSIETFSNDGGAKLIGSSVFGCHEHEANEQILDFLEHNKTNIYTIEKNGKKKLIYQAPWLENGQVAGIVELSVELPDIIPNFIRK